MPRPAPLVPLARAHLLLPGPIKVWAEQHAAELAASLSQYVASLIEQDRKKVAK